MGLFRNWLLRYPQMVRGASKTSNAPTLFAAGAVATLALSDTVDVTLPAGLADGDYAILVLALTDSSGGISSISVGAFTDRAGGNSRGAIVEASVFGSPITAADSSSVATVQFNNVITAGQLVFLVYRGTNGVDPDFSATAKGTSTSVDQPGVTSTGVALAAVCSISATVAASSPPAAWTEGLDDGTGFRLLEDHQAVTVGVVPPASRTQVSGAWITFEGLFYP